jgi:arginyl-tRNA synthetase
MNIFAILKDNMDQIALKFEQEKNLKFDKLQYSLEYPKDNKMGDISTNIAMIYAKANNMAPRVLAEILVQEIAELEDVAGVEVAGPGFININFKKDFWYKIAAKINEKSSYYGDLTAGNGTSVNVEYVSVNPTGPMHTGHARCAAFGDSLARTLIKAGYDVDKEYYVNDAGGQIDVLAESTYLRYLEQSGEKIVIPEGLYPGEYLIEPAKKLYAEYENRLVEMDKDDRMAIVKPFITNEMMNLIKQDLHKLDIDHDYFVYELEEIRNEGLIEEAIEILEEKNLIYKGILDKPKGIEVEDWEAEEQIIFKSTQFGDDIDRVVKKSDGSYTYFAGDLGYVLHKLKREYNKLIYILGADHIGYVKRLKAIVAGLSDNEVGCEVIICQMVNFMDNGQILKMSKRAGNYITVDDIYQKLGKDIIRIMMITRDSNTKFDFDLKKAVEQSNENPVFYIQYAYARIKSVYRTAAVECKEALQLIEEEKIDWHLLSDETEITIIKSLALWPRIVESAAKYYEPHRIINYVHDLASLLHGQWNLGKERSNLKFILKENPSLTAARLMLLDAVANVIKSALELCAADVMEEM